MTAWPSIHFVLRSSSSARMQGSLGHVQFEVDLGGAWGTHETSKQTFRDNANLPVSNRGIILNPWHDSKVVLQK